MDKLPLKPSNDHQAITISHEWIFGHIFIKLTYTCEKYRDIIPAVRALDDALEKLESDSAFEMTEKVFKLVGKHAKNSATVAEIIKNMGTDFLHGMNPQIPPFQGRYYITLIKN